MVWDARFDGDQYDSDAADCRDDGDVAEHDGNLVGFFKRQAPIPLSDLVVEPEPTVEPVTEPHPLYGENYEPPLS